MIRENSVPAPDTVEGERTDPLVNRSVSMQSRVSSLLAIGLIALLCVGTLAWYYSNTLQRQKHARETIKADANKQATGEMVLPSLGRVDPPPPTEHVPEEAAANPVPVSAYDTDTDLPPMLTPYSSVPSALPNDTATPAKTPAELALERRLSGAAFLSFSSTITAALPEADASTATQPDNSMATLLKSSVAPTARAQVLPTQRLLLPKGAFIDCTLETAIDSTLPGMTTCITATDTFSVDGKVVLLERGTKLFGETRGQVQQGCARIFVLWTQARTPTGVVVPLDSPGADELGRSGLPGKVNRHFWDRFGAAILISMVDGAIQSAVQSSGNGGGAIIYNPDTSQDLMTEVLKSTVNIPPTVVKSQGDRIQILVARDLDFRSVYELRPSLTAR